MRSWRSLKRRESRRARAAGVAASGSPPSPIKRGLRRGQSSGTRGAERKGMKSQPRFFSSALRAWNSALGSLLVDNSQHALLRVFRQRLPGVHHVDKIFVAFGKRAAGAAEGG